MRTVIFSDVHGNLPALMAMVQHAGTADQYVCLGDVINYGPWSNECAEYVATLPVCERLMGNHEMAFLRGKYDGTHAVARTFFEFCRPRFHRLDLITKYGASCDIGSFHAQHTINESYIYANTPLYLDRDYIIGHSHHQFIMNSNGHQLVNAGSVGQNRTDLRVCNYVVHQYDKVYLAGFIYDPMPVIDEMRRQGYPSICIDYYFSKLGTGSIALP